MTVATVKKKGKKITYFCDQFSGNGRWKTLPVGKRVSIGGIDVRIDGGKKGKFTIKVYHRGCDEPVQRGNLSDGKTIVGVRAINAL